MKLKYITATALILVILCDCSAFLCTNNQVLWRNQARHMNVKGRSSSNRLLKSKSKSSPIDPQLKWHNLAGMDNAVIMTADDNAYQSTKRDHKPPTSNSSPSSSRPAPYRFKEQRPEKIKDTSSSRRGWGLAVDARGGDLAAVVSQRLLELSQASSLARFEYHLHGLANYQVTVLNPQRAKVITPRDVTAIVAASLPWLSTMSFLSLAECVWCVGTLASSVQTSRHSRHRYQPIADIDMDIDVDDDALDRLLLDFAHSSTVLLLANHTLDHSIDSIYNSSNSKTRSPTTRLAKATGKLLTGLTKLVRSDNSDNDSPVNRSFNIRNKVSEAVALWFGSPLAKRAVAALDTRGYATAIWALGRLNCNAWQLSTEARHVLFTRLPEISRLSSFNDQALANTMLGIQLMGIEWEELPVAIKSALCSATCRLCVRMSPHAAGTLTCALGRSGLRFGLLTDRMRVAIELCVRRACTTFRCDPHTPDAAKLLQGLGALAFPWRQLTVQTRDSLAEALFLRASARWAKGAAQDPEIPSEVASCVQALVQMRCDWGQDAIDDCDTGLETSASQFNSRSISDSAALSSPLRAAVLVGLHSLTDSFQSEQQRKTRELETARLSFGAAARGRRPGLGGELDLTTAEYVEGSSLAWSLSEAIQGLAGLSGSLTFQNLPGTLQVSLTKALESLPLQFTAQAATQAPSALAALGIRWRDPQVLAIARRLQELARQSSEWYKAQKTPSSLSASNALVLTLRGISNALFGLGQLGVDWRSPGDKDVMGGSFTHLSQQLKKDLLDCLDAILQAQSHPQADLLRLEDLASLLHALAHVHAHHQDISSDTLHRLLELTTRQLVQVQVMAPPTMGSSQDFHQQRVRPASPEELSLSPAEYSKYAVMTLRGLSLMGFRFDQLPLLNISMTSSPNTELPIARQQKHMTQSMTIPTDAVISWMVVEASQEATAQGAAIMLQSLARMNAPWTVASRKTVDIDPRDAKLSIEAQFALLGALRRTAATMPAQELSLVIASLGKFGVSWVPDSSDTLRNSKMSDDLSEIADLQRELLARLAKLGDLQKAEHVIKTAVGLALWKVQYWQLPLAARLALLRSAVQYCQFDDLHPLQKAIRALYYEHRLGDANSSAQELKLYDRLQHMFLINRFS